MLPVSPIGRMRGATEFREVLRHGRRLAGTRVVLFVRPGGGTVRFGFGCARKVGRAVDRNRARRLMREACIGLASKFRTASSVVVMARPEIRGAKLSEVHEDVRRVLIAGGVIEE